HALDDLLVLGRERLEVDALRIHAAREAAVEIEHVGEAAAHAGREVPPGRTEHHHAPARHVLAAVVTDALDHRLRTAVAHAEALARQALEVGLAGGGAVQRHVARDHVLGGIEARTLRDADDDPAAREALAAV